MTSYATIAANLPMLRDLADVQAAAGAVDPEVRTLLDLEPEDAPETAVRLARVLARGLALDHINLGDTCMAPPDRRDADEEEQCNRMLALLELCRAADPEDAQALRAHIEVGLAMMQQDARERRAGC